ncbi:MAG: DUF1501 domain-containing protein [Planctomycetes bacterium]|nr:DUF1501 domain-containing protein [Planctomycetota bacterium]
MHRYGCQRTDHPNIGRRTLLQVGGLSLVGCSLSDLFRLEAEATSTSTRRAQAKAVVFIFQSGGPSQHETVDPKPAAPEDIRGEYGVTQTTIPGVNFCEYLPRLAQRLGKFSIVRTMHHPAPRQFRNEHNSCKYMLHTGTTALPPGDTNASIVNPRARSRSEGLVGQQQLPQSRVPIARSQRNRGDIDSPGRESIRLAEAVE